MFRRSPDPEPVGDVAGEVALDGPPEFWWATVAGVLAPLFAVAGLLAVLPRAGLLAVGFLVLALAGATPRRLAVRAARWALAGPWRVRLLAAGVVAAVALWARGWALLSYAAALLGAAPIFTAALGAGLRPSRERNPTVKPSAVEEWRQRVEDGWPVTAARAGLVSPDDSSVTAELVGPVEVAGPGALHYRLNVAPALRAPEDVTAQIPALVRRQRAGHIVVRPVSPHDPDLVDVWLWRGRHPLDQPVSWRDLTPLPGRPGEWVPVGRRATGGVLAMRWRLSTGYFGAPETGKTFTQRAMLYGCRVQGLPLAGGLHVIDTKGDLRPFRHLLGDRYVDTARGGRELVERFAATVEARYSRLVLGETVTPDRETPALLLVVTEWAHLRQLRAGFGKDDAAGVATALRYCAGTGRAAAAAVHLADQLTQKEELGAARDLLPQRVLHWVPEAAMVDPALGSGALDRGARAHEFPASLKGAAYVLDEETRWPVMGRPAAIDPAEAPRLFELPAAPDYEEDPCPE